MPLHERFLPAYLVVLDDLADANYFALNAPDECSDGHPVGWSPVGMHRQLIKQLGRADWPLDPDSSMTDEELIPYIQAIYQFIAKPTKQQFHLFCGANHPTEFDVTAGRYDYTVMVNELLERFQTGYRMQSGTVRTAASSVLGANLGEALPFGTDTHLRDLVTKAVLDYRSPQLADKFTAVQGLAAAYERIKSIPEPSNKRESTTQLIARMTPEADARQHLNELFTAVTNLSNTMTIRHHEVGKIEISRDRDLVDFLFHMYYNIVRLSLLTLNDEELQSQT